ncbi:hypothetical protein ACS0PU_012477 [Formica fusca]
MDKTLKETITPSGSPGSVLENPPSKEDGLTDSGGGQPLLIKGTKEITLDSHQTSNNSLTLNPSQITTLSLLNRPRASSCSGILPAHQNKEETKMDSEHKDGLNSHEGKWKEVIVKGKD